MITIKTTFYPNDYFRIEDNHKKKLEEIGVFIVNDMLILVYSGTKLSAIHLYNVFKDNQDGWQYLQARNYLKYTITNSSVSVSGELFNKIRKQLDLDTDKISGSTPIIE